MRIINFGSLNIDYVYRVDHFVRPGETILSENLCASCGGKGLNQSIAVSRAGSQIYHAGLIGKDGTMLKNLLKDSGVNVDYVQECDQVTGHAIIQVDQRGQNSILLYSGANYEITEAYVDAVLSNFAKNDVLLVQNEISKVGYIMEQAHKKGLRIIFNPSPINSGIEDLPLDYVDDFILNEIEGHAITEKDEPEQIVEAMLQKFHDSAVVLTLGKKGVLYKHADVTERHGVYHMPCVDTTGAGDTFTGYFVSGIVSGLSIKETLRKASVASSIAISRRGAALSIPRWEEVDHANLKLEPA